MDEAELLAFGVAHHGDDSFGVVVPLAGELPAQGLDLGDARLDVWNRDLEMGADPLRARPRDQLGHLLPGQFHVVGADASSGVWDPDVSHTS